MSTWETNERRFGLIKGLDPNVEWLLDDKAGQSLFLRKSLASTPVTEPPFAFLLTPPDKTTAQRILRGLDRIAKVGPDMRFNISKADRDRFLKGQTAGALCNAAFMKELAAPNPRDPEKPKHAVAGLPKAMQVSSALPGAAAPDRNAPPFKPPRGLEKAFKNVFSGDSVVIGVIDDGFAIAHPRLRLAVDSTRVASYWDQETAYPVTVPTVPFGRELLKADFGGNTGLDTILASYSGPVAEIYGDKSLSAFYPKKRNLMPRNTSHGTVVLDLAAGENLGDGADRPVVAVKLPRASVLDTSGAHLDFFLLQGIHHILSRAEMITGRKDPKVIIVASYGYFGGPLDGASQFEREVDHIIQSRKGRVQIVLPSGNGRMKRAHAVRPDSGKVGDLRTVKWRSPAGDRTPSVMELWTDPVVGSASDPSLSFSVETPFGLSSASINFTDSDINKKLVLKEHAPGGTARIMAEVVCDHPPLHPGRRRFLVWLSPTALPPPDVAAPPALSPSGVWKINLETIAPTATDVSVWIRRDDSLPGFPTLGRQSSIERDPPNEGPIPMTQQEWDLWDEYGTASVTGTISAIATGESPVVTCGYGAINERPARSAAGGPVALMPGHTTGRRAGPDCFAPSQVTPLRGIKAANFFGGAKVSMSGTSLAAPLLGYWLSGLYLAKNHFDGRIEARQEAQNSDAHMPPGWKPRMARGGYRFSNSQMMERTFKMDEE